MGTFFNDLRFGIRMLWKAPVVSGVAALSLALGIAATAATLSVANSFFRESFAYADSHRLAMVWEENLSREALQVPASPGNFLDWREATRAFESLAGYTIAPANVTGAEADPEQVQVVSSTPDFLGVLGVQPLLGRSFRPEEGAEGNDRVAVLLHDFWDRRFLGDRNVLGRVIELDGEPHTVIGVMGPDFELIPANVHLLRPTDFADQRDIRDSRSVIVMGRLAAGVGVEQASAELAGVHERLAELHPDANRDWRARAELLSEFFPGPTDTQLVLILVAVSFFGLLIGCANVANLLLGRAEERQKEIAIRTALGAGRARILRQLLTESVVLATVAGLLGVGGSVWVIQGLGTAMPPELPQAFYPRLTADVLLGVVGVVLGAGVAFGLAPALHAARGELRDSLGESRGGTATRSRKRLRNAFVIGEFAVALALLTGSALLVRAFDELSGGDQGFTPEGVLTFNLSLPENRYDSDEAVERFWRETEAQLAALPGVDAAAVMSSLPRSRNNPGAQFQVEGEPVAEPSQRPRSDYQVVTAGYLETLEVDLVAGRFMEDGDRADALPVAVVNQAFVRRHLPEREPLGARLVLEAGSSEPREIVGVVSDVAQDRLSINSEPPPVVYLPLAQMPRRAMNLAVRVRGDEPAAFASTARSAVWSVDPDLPVAQMRTLEDHIAEMLAGPRAIGVFLSAIGGIALLLAALGIYGVMAHSVVQRTREIGIRMAMGAERGRVVGMVVRSGLTLAALGLVVGLPLSFVMFRVVASALTGLTDAFNPWLPFLVVTSALALMAGLACLLPARKAAGIEPVRALQGD